MTSAQTFNEDQRSRWNGADGDYWTIHQNKLDTTLAPVMAPLLAFAKPAVGSTVLDIGCGCGATTVQLAQAVGEGGRVIGLDISEPMLAVAAERLRDFPNATSVCSDAAKWPVQDLGAELIFSRFGVMFFGDPEAAFTNLRNALLPGGRLRFVCWRSLQENPWMQVPLHAAYEHVPRLPKPLPEEPGPFALADPARVTRILTAAGFTKPTFTPFDFAMDIAAGGTLEDAVAQSTQMGAAKRALADQPEHLRRAVVESIRRALAPYASANGVALPGAVWFVAADRT